MKRTLLAGTLATLLSVPALAQGPLRIDLSKYLQDTPDLHVVEVHYTANGISAHGVSAEDQKVSPYAELGCRDAEALNASHQLCLSGGKLQLNLFLGCAPTEPHLLFKAVPPEPRISEITLGAAKDYARYSIPTCR